jgi:membrane-associated phospholipid phosphatase
MLSERVRITTRCPAHAEQARAARTVTAARVREDIGPILVPDRVARKLKLRASELSMVLALGTMTLIAWANPEEIPLASRVGYALVGLLFAVTVLALGEQTDGWRYWARELMIVPVIPYIFLNLGRLIPLVNPAVRDDLLIAADRLILGAESQLALYKVHLPAVISDVLTVAYSSYFFLPVILVVTLSWRRDPLLPRVAAILAFNFLVSYVGYFVVPAYGPRATIAQMRWAELPPGVVGEQLRDLLDHWEKTKTDAFPSGHTMVTLATLICARRRRPALYHALLPVGTLLITATILLTYHYVVDVLAAVPLVVLAFWLAHLCSGPLPSIGFERPEAEAVPSLESASS